MNARMDGMETGKLYFFSSGLVSAFFPVLNPNPKLNYVSYQTDRVQSIRGDCAEGPRHFLDALL